MNIKEKIFALLIAIPAVVSCSCSNGAEKKGGDAASADEVAVSAPIQRLDRVVASRPDTIPAEMEEQLDVYLKLVNRSTGDMVADIAQFADSEGFRFFYDATEQRLGDLSEVERSLGRLNEALAADFSRIAPQKFYGIVSPRNEKQVFTTDSATYIVLNFYLGGDYEGYAPFPDYRRRQFAQPYIAPNVAEALIAGAYPFQTTAETTALNRMIYEGALAQTVMAATGADLQTYLGWTDEQLNFVNENERTIWQKMIADDLLYSPNPTIASRLVDPSPATTLISSMTPGRVGRYIGYRIVSKYLTKHPNTTLEQLLQPSFYNSPSVLPDAGYAP